MSFTDILAAYVADVALQTGNISLAEAQVIIHAMEEHFDKFQGKQCALLFIRKLGVGTCVLAPSADELHFDTGAKVVIRLHISSCIEQLKMALS